MMLIREICRRIPLRPETGKAFLEVTINTNCKIKCHKQDSIKIKYTAC